MMGKKMMNPVNVICVTVIENSNGTVTYNNEGNRHALGFGIIFIQKCM